MASQLKILAGTMADDATVGTVAWTNPNNAKVSDNVYATVVDNVGNLNLLTHYLKATNFGFSIPTGATINGILVEAEVKASQYTSSAEEVRENSTKIVKSNGSFGTTEKANTAQANHYPTTEAYRSYGANNDLWGETWSYSDINNSNFGVGISARLLDDGGGVTSYIDHIRITVYYTTTSYSGILKRPNGSNWVKAKLKNYNGSSFVVKQLKRFDGTNWLDVDNTG
jgi:hypothetical protein